MTMSGGNTKAVYNIDKAGDIYNREGEEFDHRREFAESLHAQHPDAVQITQKWGRWHHHINYNEFQVTERPKLKAGLNITKGPDNYGLKLVRLKGE